jgi:hypothetical protein
MRLYLKKKPLRATRAPPDSESEVAPEADRFRNPQTHRRAAQRTPPIASIADDPSTAAPVHRSDTKIRSVWL